MAVTVFIAGNTFYLVLGQFAHIPRIRWGRRHYGSVTCSAALTLMALLHYSSCFTISTVLRAQKRVRF